MSTSKKIRSTKTQICIAVMFSCECTSENGNTVKTKSVGSGGSAEMPTNVQYLVHNCTHMSINVSQQKAVEQP